MARKKIQGFLHYRTDLGDGVRTGVVFSDCVGHCSEVCSSYRFIPDHEFCEDTEEQEEYTPEELANYLLEEKTLYYARKLGITFLGKEPLWDPFFCTDVARALKEAKIGLQVHTCGMCSMTAFERLDGLVELYVLRVFLPLFDENSKENFDRGVQTRRVIEWLEKRETFYRLSVTIFPDVTEKELEAFAEYILNLRFMKSVILDFSFSKMSPSEQTEVRKVFLKRKIPLY